MTTLTIRNVDPALKEELRVRAARHGRSMEAELRHILKEALGGEKRAEPNLAEAIRRRSCRWAAPTSLSRTRPCPCAIRLGSTGDRPRHQRPL
jgi:plasmid stability protein